MSIGKEITEIHPLNKNSLLCKPQLIFNILLEKTRKEFQVTFNSVYIMQEHYWMMISASFGSLFRGNITLSIAKIMPLSIFKHIGVLLIFSKPKIFTRLIHANFIACGVYPKWNYDYFLKKTHLTLVRGMKC